MFFWNSLAFSVTQQMLAIWSLVPLPFLNPAWTSGSSLFSSCTVEVWLGEFWTFASVWDECNCAVVQTCFGMAFLWGWNENGPFPVLWPLLSFPDSLTFEWSTFTASSFRIWKGSTGIPSPPLALFIVMLSKAPLTSHSRMSGSRWVITPLWLSGSWRSLLYSSSVYFCYLFLISSASVRSIPFLPIIEPIFARNVPLVSDFLEEISSLSHSVVFLCFFVLIAEEGFLISPCYSLEFCI